MYFDLISAYSCRISWVSSTEKVEKIECFRDGFYQSALFENDDVSVVIVNLEPGLEYTVKVSAGDKCITDTFETCSEEEPCLENLYSGLKNQDGQVNTKSLNKKVHDIFVENFSKIVNSGDSILANVSVNGVSKEIETVAVRDGDKLDVESTSVFLPFSKENNSFMQTATLVKNNEEAVLSYDREEDAFGYGGEMYKVGDKFEMFGQMVTVGDGSIVLIFADTVARTWGFSQGRAEAVVAGTAGSSFTSNVTAQVFNSLMEFEVDVSSGSTYQSSWAVDPTNSTVSEVTRFVHTINQDGRDGLLSLGVLHTDASDNVFIEPTIQSAYDYTSISSQDESDATRSAVFRSTGLQFDNDDAAVYFGANQQFRIIFSEEEVGVTPDTLKIEYFNGTEYVAKTEFTAGS